MLFLTGKNPLPHLSSEELLKRANLEPIVDKHPWFDIYELEDLTPLGRNDKIGSLDQQTAELLFQEMDNLDRRLIQLSEDAMLKNGDLQKYLARFISAFQPFPNQPEPRKWSESEAQTLVSREMGITSEDLQQLIQRNPATRQVFQRKVAWLTNSPSPFQKKVEEQKTLSQVARELHELSQDIQIDLFWKYVKSFKTILITYIENGKKITSPVTNLDELKVEKVVKPTGKDGPTFATMNGFTNIVILYNGKPVESVSPGGIRDRLAIQDLRINPVDESQQSGRIMLSSRFNIEQIYLEGDHTSFREAIAEELMMHIVFEIEFFFHRRTFDESRLYGYETESEDPADTVPELNKLWKSFLADISMPFEFLPDSYEMRMQSGLANFSRDRISYADIYRFCRWSAFLSPGGMKGTFRRLGLKLRRMRWSNFKMIIGESLKESFSKRRCTNDEITHEGCRPKSGLFFSALASSNFRRGIEHYDGPTNPSNASLSELLKTVSSHTSSPDFRLSANPFRFGGQLRRLDELSAYSHDQNPSFRAYYLPSEPKKGITISSRKPVFMGVDPDDKQVIRLFTPQFSVINRITISSGNRPLVEKKDYEIEYDDRLGYYRVVLTGDFQSDEFSYKITIDPNEKQGSSPKKVDKLSVVQAHRLEEFTTQLALVGYTELAESLQKMIQYTQATNGVITTQTITNAVIKGASYSIASDYSDSEIQHAFDLEGVDLSMIPAPTTDGRLLLQCTHAATLLSALFEYVLREDLVEKGGGFYTSSMYPLVSLGIGVKFSSTPHSDTRGQIGSEFVRHDATPPIRIQKVLERIKQSYDRNSPQSHNEQNLGQTNASEIEEPEFIHFERVTLSFGVYEQLILELTPRDSRGQIPISARFPEAITAVGGLFKDLQQFSKTISSPLELQPSETITSLKIRIRSAVEIWSIKHDDTDRKRKNEFLKVFGNYYGAKKHALNLLELMDQYLDSLIF